MSSQPLKIHIIISSTRENRFGDKPAKWVYDFVSKIPGIKAELIDLRDHPLPFYNEALSVTYLKGDYKTPGAREWAAKIGEADGFIFVTAEYNHGYPAVLKNAIDYVYFEWNRKPVAFVGYGSVEGARSIEQLRQVVAELQMVSIRKAVHIRQFWTLQGEEGDVKPGAFDEYNDELKDMTDHLVWWGKALKEAREKK